MRCRFCHHPLEHEFVDLHFSPLANAFLTANQLSEPETYYPLKLFVCENCWLVQIDEYVKSADIFNSDYAYFSSYSKTWLNHAKNYVQTVCNRFGFNEDSQIIEIASNDGYLLQYFLDKNIPVLGIEPAANVARVAEGKGIRTIKSFFGEKLSRELAAENVKGDLIVGNNVFAHVPNVNDFVTGLKIILSAAGILTLEFPYLVQLIDQNQFDTIYHEHFSYFSLHAARSILADHGLELFDVEQLPTHGGSLRIYAKHKEDISKIVLPKVAKLIKYEKEIGVTSTRYYEDFKSGISKIRIAVLKFLFEMKEKNKRVVAYGAAAKGNTLLNYCGIRCDLIDFVVDKSPHKQGKFLPGSHIPVVKEDIIKSVKPDYVFILPWNIKKEIISQLGYIREWNGEFFVAIPSLRII